VESARDARRPAGGRPGGRSEAPAKTAMMIRCVCRISSRRGLRHSKAATAAATIRSPPLLGGAQTQTTAPALPFLARAAAENWATSAGTGRRGLALLAARRTVAVTARRQVGDSASSSQLMLGRGLWRQPARSGVRHFGSSSKGSGPLVLILRVMFQIWVRVVLRMWRDGEFRGKHGRQLLLWTVGAPCAGALGCGGLYAASGLDINPETGRWRGIYMSRATELELGKEGAESVLRHEHARLLPREHPSAQYVQGVASMILAAVVDNPGFDPDLDWQVHVIKSAVQNAFVLPDGQIFVYTGLLDVCETQEQLGFVLGHEVAHALSRHSAEKLGFAAASLALVEVLQPMVGRRRYYRHSSAEDWAIDIILSIASLAASLVFERMIGLAYSRKLETEADYLGQAAMAKAGFDPRQAAQVWINFQKRVDKGSNNEFWSTHPSHQTRIDNLTEWEEEHLETFRLADEGILAMRREQERMRAAARRQEQVWRDTDIEYSDESLRARSQAIAQLASCLAVGSWTQMVRETDRSRALRTAAAGAISDPCCCCCAGGDAASLAAAAAEQE
jgi:hypothetical protein